MFSSAQSCLDRQLWRQADVTGSAMAPVKVTSWDVDRSEPREITEDGRAYIRFIGGTVLIEHASFESFGVLERQDWRLVHDRIRPADHRSDERCRGGTGQASLQDSKNP